MNSLSCWQDDQHPVARNDFGLGKTVVLDEVHHRDEMSTQRSTVTAAWSSSSYVRNCACPQTAYQRVAETKRYHIIKDRRFFSRGDVSNRLGMFFFLMPSSSP